MAWMIEQNERCQVCGTFAWEWGTEDDPIDAYEADGHLCHGCSHLDVEKERRSDEPQTPGVRLVLYPKVITDGP